LHWLKSETRYKMKPFPLSKLASALVLVFLTVAGCSRPSTKSPDVSSAVRQSLEQAGFKDVSVDQDRDKGVVILGGHVVSEDAKSQIESIAKTIAAGQVVANQVAVIPPGSEKIAKTVNSDLDKGIEKNLDAVLVANQLDSQLKYEVKNRVVVLKGEVDSQAKRAQAATVASSVPNVDQVVNEVQVKNQKATSF
jgi:osmotically-inducible protein OsmY